MTTSNHHIAFVTALIAVLSVAGCTDDDIAASTCDEGGKCDGVAPEIGPNGELFSYQGWTPSTRQHFYQTSQGAQFMPYAWLLALEVATSDELVLSEPALRQYNLIPNPNHPDRLPVGFAKQSDPVTGEWVGINCAACHTAQLRYNGKTVRIDGGAGMTDLAGWAMSAGFSVIVTSNDPAKFDRFAARVLADVDPAQLPQATQALRAAMGQYTSQLLALAQIPVTVTEGFGRLDAVNRAANLLLSNLDPANARPVHAPVSIPSIWGATRFDWMHYSGSSNQALSRNALQALGAFSKLVLAPGPDQFSSSVDVVALGAFEDSVDKLKAPKWPAAVFGALDVAASLRGRQLYVQHCGSCHDGTQNGDVLMVTRTPLAQVGTDPAYLTSIDARSPVKSGVLGLGDQAAYGDVVIALTNAVIEKRFDDLALSQAQRTALTGPRPNDFRIENIYKANPLTGIWATPPYLHNGSVPSLSQLLLPAAQRTKKFSVGNLNYDPVNVGFDTAPGAGQFLVDTTLAGNSNAGHEYGVTLSESDRRDLVEYLKTL